MMKLTVAFLGALAAADAAEARSHRQARRQYGYGNGYGGGSYGSGVSSAKPAETPKVSSIPYVQSSAETFKTSLPVDAASSYVPTPTPEVPEGGKASSTPVVPASSVVVEKPSSAPVVVASSSVAVPVQSSAVPSKGIDYGNGYGTNPASSSKVPSNSAATPSSVVPGVVPSSSAVPSGVKPSSGVAKPSGGYGGAFSASSVVVASSKVPSNSGVFPSSGAVYPTGTGSKPSATPLTDMVTKTIYSTQIYQISSKLATTVVPVGTTVCPKDEASVTPSASATPVKVVTSEYPVSEITKKVTETLVYTVGVGSTAHPVTTEVVSTSTSTVYKTVVVTLAKPTPTPGQGGPAYPAGGEDEQTSTKTIKSTSTTTKYITVKPTPSGKVPVGAEGTPVPGQPGGPAGGENCAAPVTVTVTAKETVTVTKGQENSKPTPGAEKPSGKPTQPEAPVKPSGGAYMPTKPSAVPSGKYPIGNGTHPYPAGPTGFKTSTKPAVPVGTGGSNYGTGVPVKPSTSSLPAFSFVSEQASKTPSMETGVPVPSATPSAAYPPAGGNYGNGYGANPAPSSSKAVVETPAVPSSKVPSNEQSTPAAKPTPTPTPAGNGYGSGYGTY